jgi:glutamine synthetase
MSHLRFGGPEVARASGPPDGYCLVMRDRVRMGRDDLLTAIADGSIDTVIMAFADHQGRLVGKRTDAAFFVEHVADHGTENCDYLIARDLDDVPVAGLDVASYADGYGDMVAVADWSTVRRLPWSPGTALVICDLTTTDGSPIGESPRRILAEQVATASAAGFSVCVGSEIEFHLFRHSREVLRANGFRRPDDGSHVQDYDLAQSAIDEPVIGSLRRSLPGAGVPVEFSKGEAGRGQYEINLSYADPVEMADRNLIFKQAVREVATTAGRAVTFMAKADTDETGSSCHVHVSLWSPDGAEPAFDAESMNDTLRHCLGGLLATARDFSLLWAPTVNSYRRFQPASWAPTSIGWAHDNRTVGFRVVGTGPSSRVECRIPGADANSHLAFAGVLAGGLHGLRHRLEPPPAVAGDAHLDTGLPRLPLTLGEAIAAWEASEVARECFGDAVHRHVAGHARHEWESFGRAVTDWERQRYFERI